MTTHLGSKGLCNTKEVVLKLRNSYFEKVSGITDGMDGES